MYIPSVLDIAGDRVPIALVRQISLFVMVEGHRKNFSVLDLFCWNCRSLLIAFLPSEDLVCRPDGHAGNGVCAAFPGVIDKQKLSVVCPMIDIQPDIRHLGTRSLWHACFTQHKMVGYVCQLAEAQGISFIVSQRHFSGRVCQTGTDRAASGRNRIFVIRRVKLKLRACHGISKLIRLCDEGFGNLHQVKFQAQVGLAIAAFKIEKFQRMNRIIGEGLACPLFGAFPSRLLKLLIKRCGCGRLIACAFIYDDFTGSEVYIERNGVMDSPNIRDQDVVNKNPYIIIARKMIYDIILIIVGLSVAQLDEARRHCQAKIVTKRRIRIAVILILHLVVGIKGKELSLFCCVIRDRNAGFGIERKTVFRLVKFRKIFVAVVIIVAIRVLLKQTGDICIASLSLRLIARIKQIGEGLFLCNSRMDGISRACHRVIVRQNGLNNSLTRVQLIYRGSAHIKAARVYVLLASRPYIRGDLSVLCVKACRVHPPAEFQLRQLAKLAAYRAVNPLLYCV